MKALTLSMGRYLEYKQKSTLDPNFTFEMHDIVTLEDIPDVNLINDNWVKIKVKLGGICGTDLSFLKMRNSMCLSNLVSFPCVPGHEIVGDIVEIGKKVENLAIGDRVVIDEILGCKAREIELCKACEEGDYNLCSNMDKGVVSPGALIGFCKETGGAWGEYVVAHKFQVFKIPDSISFEEAIIAEPLACAIHGVLKRIPKENDTCVVVGGGTIGLSTIFTLKSFSKCKIIVVVKYPFQSELAKKMGADEVFLVKKDLHIKKIARNLGCKILSPAMEKAFPMGGGADIVIDSVGNESSLTDCLRLVKPKGTVIMIGYPAKINVDWTPMIAKEVKIITSSIFSYETLDGEKKRTLQVALDLIAGGDNSIKELVTHKFKLEDYKEALNLTLNKNEHQATKVAFSF